MILGIRALLDFVLTAHRQILTPSVRQTTLRGNSVDFVVMDPLQTAHCRLQDVVLPERISLLNGRCTDCSEANELLRKTCRPGWTLNG